MLIKTERYDGSMLYFDASRVLYVIERGSSKDDDWFDAPPGTGDYVAKVCLDADGANQFIYFYEKSWEGVRILLGIDTAIQVDAANPRNPEPGESSGS